MRYVSIIITILLFGCNSSVHDNAKVIKDSACKADARGPKNDTIVKQPLIIRDTFKVPSQYLYSIAKFLDSIGFKPDSNWAKEQKGYYTIRKNTPIFKVKGVPFYKMDTLSNLIFSNKKHIKSALSEAYHVLEEGCKFNYMVFYKVKSITGYYIRKDLKSKGGTATKGAIEEWEFSNNAEAKVASTELQKENDLAPYVIYFGSIHYAYCNGKYLYIIYFWSYIKDEQCLDKMVNEMEIRRK